MKTCFKCGKEKSLDDFYRHGMMADGHLNKCKLCTKKDVSDYRQGNLAKVQAYDRYRGRTNERREKNKSQYELRMSTSEGRELIRKYSKKTKEKNKLQVAARAIVFVAIRSGKLVKKPCSRCGTTKKITAHHEDYMKPLEVTWLCYRCHGKRHQEINDELRAREIRE